MNSIVQSFYNWYSNTLRNTKYRWVIILGTLLYLASPIDIAPDFLPIVGLLDDGMILTLLLTELSQMLIEYRSRRKGSKQVNNTPSTPSSEDDAVKVKVEVV